MQRRPSPMLLLTGSCIVVLSISSPALWAEDKIPVEEERFWKSIEADTDPLSAGGESVPVARVGASKRDKELIPRHTRGLPNLPEAAASATGIVA